MHVNATSGGETDGRMKSGSTLTIVLAALALLPLWAGATEACVLDAENETASLSGGAVLAYRLSEPTSVPGQIEIECLDQQVERISVVLPAGSERDLALVVGRHQGLAIEADFRTSMDWARVAVEAAGDGSADRVLLSFRAPGNAEEGAVLEGSLQLYDSASKGDQTPISIPLKLTVRGEAPLFRDQFDNVDPVIGQFSQVM